MTKIVALVLGALAALLGGFWLLQGLAIVRVDPIACVGACTPLEGPSMVWALVGLATLALGLSAVYYGVRRRR